MTKTSSIDREQRKFKRLLLPFRLRCLTTLMIPVFAWSSLPVTCRAAVEIQLDKATTDAAKSPSAPVKALKKPNPNATPPPLPANLVAQDRPEPAAAQPKAEVKFSKTPSDQELSDCTLLAEPLVPTDAKSEPKANRALADALLNQSAAPASVKQQAVVVDTDAPGAHLRQFLSYYPKSHWRASVLLNLGLMERQAGYYSRALNSFEESWKLSKNAKGTKVEALANRALGEVAELNSRLGRRTRLEALVKELDQSHRKLTGAVTEKVGRARQGVWLMEHQPEKAYRCGPMALDRILAHSNKDGGGKTTIVESKSSDQGMSLTQIWKLSQQLKDLPPMQMAKRTSNATGDFPVPSVIHWKAGHFAALLEKNTQGLYRAEDPTFGDQIWVTRSALEEEASGYFLVQNGPLPTGWASLSEQEGNAVWGKGTVGGQNPNRTNCARDTQSRDCPNCGLAKPGMPEYNVHAMVVSLSIFDTPLEYKPPVGQQISFSAVYAHREANQPSTFQYWNLGPKWTSNWFSCILDYGYFTYDGSPGNATIPYYHQWGSYPTVYLQGGGLESYATSDPVGQPVDGLILRYQYSSPESRLTLVQTSDDGSSYERDLPGGAKQLFGLSTAVPSSPGQPHRLFLTQDIDPQGNTIVYGYDPQFRLVTVRDAAHNFTTLQYEDPTDNKRLTSVSDPFGRVARLHYNPQGQLDSITDVMNNTSSFQYGDGDFIQTMTTPYGPYTFTRGDSTTDPNLGTTRWLEARDPLGNIERTEFRQDPTGIASSDPVTPAGVPVFNLYLNARNSFFWDKAAYARAKHADGTFDYAQARLYHWCHDVDVNMASGIIESTKQPVENRVWYFYDGQTSPGFLSATTTGNPTLVGRVLDDGSTQLTQATYDSKGHLTSTTDPLGRITQFDYSSGDLVAVHRKGTATSPIDEVVMSADYNGQHEPHRITDAAGQDTLIHYKNNGQPQDMTNARGEVVTFHYTDDYLDEIFGPITGDQITFGYDTKGRVNQVTNSDGYTVATTYDDLNRPLTATYPDGSFTQVVYDRLHMSWSQNREGNWTQFLVNPLRQVEVVHDPKGSSVQYDWCGCGRLLNLTDGNGNTTSWIPDLAGRTHFRGGPDGNWTTYTYESTTSRIKTITDAKNQVATFTYNLDNTLANVSYNNAQIATPSVSYSYDPQRGRLTGMTDGTGNTNYSYYPLGVLGGNKVQTVQGPLPTSTVNFGYDELGRLSNRSINGVVQTLLRDALGRVSSINNALGGFTYQYDGVSSRTTEVDGPNGRKTTFAYFDVLHDGRLQEIKNLGPDGSVFSQFDYNFDAGSRVSNWTRQLGTQSDQYSFSYDALGQLTHATQTSGTNVLASFGYSYDDAGNRISSQTGTALTHTTSDDSNAAVLTEGGGPVRFAGQLTKPAGLTIGGVPAMVDSRNRFEAKVNLSPGIQTVPFVATDTSDNSTMTHSYQVSVVAGNSRNYTRDNNGNITSSSSPDGSGAPNATYEWDAVDRLSAVTIGAHRTEIQYDGLGRRSHMTEKDSGNITTEKRFLWCGNELCEERDANGGTVTRRFFGQGEQRVGGSDAGLYFYSRDHLGSIRELTDTSGALRARYDYDVWGQRSKVAGNLDCDFGFTGFYFHSASGLDFSRTRAYDSSLGKWINRDPIREAGGVNLYGYAANNPISFTDRSGLVWGADWLDNPIFDPVIQGAADAVSGFAHFATFGISDLVQGALGLSSSIDECSGAYAFGEAAGFLAGLLDGEAEEEAGYTVYRSLDEAGEVQYVGITTNLERRAAEHLADTGIEIEEINGLTGLSRGDARAVEQTLIDTYGLGKNGGSLLNKINSISPTRDTPFYLDSLLRGRELLQGVR
jgi:RHS repeat-associated protein